MKKIFILFFLIIFILGIFIGLRKNNAPTYQVTKIKIDDRTIIAEIADTREKRELGLSGRKSLSTNRGMLFVFDKVGEHGFWMKEMNFPIDIVWLDADKKVIGITKNLQPNSYPKLFYPPGPIKYALEISPR